MKPLNYRQRAFADRYIETGDITQSYIDAGYSSNSRNAACVEGKKLLERHEGVKKYIEEVLEGMVRAGTADAREVMECLTEVVRGEMTEEVISVVSIGDGKSQVVKTLKRPCIKDRVRAAELLARRFGLLIEKVDLSTSGPIVITGDNEIDD